MAFVVIITSQNEEGQRSFNTLQKSFYIRPTIKEEIKNMIDNELPDKFRIDCLNDKEEFGSK